MVNVVTDCLGDSEVKFLSVTYFCPATLAVDCRTHAKIVHVCIVGVDNRIECSEHENLCLILKGT